MQKNAKIYIAGHTGMVGSAILRRLLQNGYRQLIHRSSSELDLRDQQAVSEFFAREKPEYVFLAAARVGGIMANLRYKADFIYDNLMIQSNVIHSAYNSGVKKLLFLGSSCIYPKDSRIPISEDQLLSGQLEPTNDAYAVAKIAGIYLCRSYHEQYGCNFISAMPCNLYGPNDNYDPENSHVLAALMRKIYEAKVNNQPTVTIWGSGKPRREFLHVDDLAEACHVLMKNYHEPGIVNIGTGSDISILELAGIIKNAAGYDGTFLFDLSKPDGVYRKVLNTSAMNGMGWYPSTELSEGIHHTYQAYCMTKTGR